MGLYVGHDLGTGGDKAVLVDGRGRVEVGAERAGEMANMRANGLRDREINRMLTLENMLLVLIGIPIGLILGYAVSAAFMQSFNVNLRSNSRVILQPGVVPPKPRACGLWPSLSVPV